MILDNEEGTCILVDVAISGDSNVIKKEAGNFLNCKELAIEVHRMWNGSTKVMPVIVGATEAISKTVSKYRYDVHLTRRNDIKELQKRAVLSCARVLWRVLMYRYRYRYRTCQHGK
jgi:hypothetical protein